MTGNIYKAIEVMMEPKLGKEPCCPHPCAIRSACFHRGVLQHSGWHSGWGHGAKVKAVQSPREMEENLHFPVFLLTAQSSPSNLAGVAWSFCLQSPLVPFAPLTPLCYSSTGTAQFSLFSDGIAR